MMARRAAQLLVREYPEFDLIKAGLSLIKTEQGWWTTRTAYPTKACSDHYVWRDALVTIDTQLEDGSTSTAITA